MKIVPPVLEPWTDLATEGMVRARHLHPGPDRELLHRRATSPGLLSRSAMLPLIVFSILFGFGVNLVAGS